MQLHWLPVKFRNQFKIILLTYKSLHALAPRYLSDLLHPSTPLQSLRSSDKDQLAIPRTRLKTFGDRAFCVSAPPLTHEPTQRLCAFCTLTHLPTHTPSYTSRSREATLSILKSGK